MNMEQEFNRRASLLLCRVRAEVTDGARGDVHQLIREVAHRAGVSARVEALARDAWDAEAVLARPEVKANPQRIAILALARAASKLCPPGRRLEWAA